MQTNLLPDKFSIKYSLYGKTRSTQNDLGSIKEAFFPLPLVLYWLRVPGFL